jgi:hypothetical protein
VRENGSDECPIVSCLQVRSTDQKVEIHELQVQ